LPDWLAQMIERGFWLRGPGWTFATQVVEQGVEAVRTNLFRGRDHCHFYQGVGKLTSQSKPWRLFPNSRCVFMAKKEFTHHARPSP
jgi:hypothetical protein